MLRTVSLPASFTNGTLHLCSMPGRYEPLEVFLQEAAAAEVGHVLCLVADGEISRKSPDYHAAIRQDLVPVELLRHGIPDYGLPEDVQALEQMLDRVIGLLGDGKPVVIHCAGGHGRTGMAAILLLARMGLPSAQAFESIRRAGSFPDTPAQRIFIEERIAAWGGGARQDSCGPQTPPNT